MRQRLVNVAVRVAVGTGHFLLYLRLDALQDVDGLVGDYVTCRRSHLCVEGSLRVRVLPRSDHVRREDVRRLALSSAKRSMLNVIGVHGL